MHLNDQDHNTSMFNAFKLSEVSVVTQKASFTTLAIKMYNASALYAES